MPEVLIRRTRIPSDEETLDARTLSRLTVALDECTDEEFVARLIEGLKAQTCALPLAQPDQQDSAGLFEKLLQRGLGRHYSGK